MSLVSKVSLVPVVSLVSLMLLVPVVSCGVNIVFGAITSYGVPNASGASGVCGINGVYGAPMVSLVSIVSLVPLVPWWHFVLKMQHQYISFKFKPRLTYILVYMHGRGPKGFLAVINQSYYCPLLK